MCGLKALTKTVADIARSVVFIGEQKDLTVFNTMYLA